MLLLPVLVVWLVIIKITTRLVNGLYFSISDNLKKNPTQVFERNFSKLSKPQFLCQYSCPTLFSLTFGHYIA